MTTDMTTDMTTENHRFYENEYPKEGDFVIVEINEINHIGAYVSLLEYGEIKGMIPINEMTNRRFRSINKLAKVGRTEVVLVLKVDEEKGYIDLSKSRVTTDDTERCEDKWNKAKCIQSIMNRVAVETSKSLREIHENITWILYKKYENLYDKFKECVERDNFDNLCDDLCDDLRDIFIKNIKKRIQLSSCKINSEIDVTCITYEGIESIKSAFKCALYEYGLLGLQINLVTPPTFSVCINVKDKNYGFKIVSDALSIISKRIKELGGMMTVKVAPFVSFN